MPHAGGRAESRGRSCEADDVASMFTSREREVLTCLAEGFDNREMAEALVVSVRTVNRHLENIRMKVGARRRSELVRLGRQLDGR